jgi:DNA-binding CsgD family transcriptional regulator
MFISDNHISVKSGDDIRTICKPLFDRSDISFFIYCRFYDDGTLVSFPSNTAWHKHFMEKEYFSNKLRMKEGLHLWASHEQYSKATIEARKHFNIDNKFEIVERGANYYDVYGFASSKGKNRIIDYYINNIDYLKKFGLYFKNKAEKLIDTARTVDNRLLIHHQIVDCEEEIMLEYVDDFMRNRIKHYYVNTRYSSDLYLTSRETQILLYTLQQRSAVDIGRIVGISPKTVESYLAKAKEKLGCETRPDLFDIALESGLLQLITSKERK